MLGMFFSGFLFISTHILLDLLSLGSAKAYTGWGKKLNSHLMASFVKNILTKNYQNLIIGFQVTVKNVGDVFFGTQCIIRWSESVMDTQTNLNIPPYYNIIIFNCKKCKESKKKLNRKICVSLFSKTPILDSIQHEKVKSYMKWW